MKLYHGSNVEIFKVELEKCMPYKDFGKGFYTTTLKEQAWRMAKRRAVTEGGRPIVTIFEIPDELLSENSLNCRVFSDKPSVEWAVFVKNNRDKKFEDISSPECNLDGKYDVVVGPVADDTIGLLVRQFQRGLIDEKYLTEGFSFDKVTNQYTFHTEKALKYLKKVGVNYDE